MLFEGFFNPRVQSKEPSMPQIKTALTQTAIINMMQGNFVEIPVKKLSLKPNEKCIFCDHGILITETLKVVGGNRRGGGFSFRICRGMTYHTGNGANATVRDKVAEYDQGKLYITDKRVIFFSDNRSFQKKMSDVVTYKVENSCLVIQFASKSYKVFLQVPECAEKALENVL